MTWSYRIVKKDGFYSIHEVYYDSKNKPEKVTEDEVAPTGETLQELKRDFKFYKKAFLSSPLDYDDFK